MLRQVVLSMGLTPLLASLGAKVAEATAPEVAPGEDALCVTAQIAKLLCEIK